MDHFSRASAFQDRIAPDLHSIHRHIHDPGNPLFEGINDHRRQMFDRINDDHRPHHTQTPPNFGFREARDPPALVDNIVLQGILNLSIIDLEVEGRLVGMLVDQVKEWSDADKVVPQPDWGSLIGKAKEKAGKVDLKISLAREMKQKKNQPATILKEIPKLLAVDFSDLHPGIAHAFLSILGSFSSLKLKTPLSDFSRWIAFAESVHDVTEIFSSSNSLYMANLIRFTQEVRRITASNIIDGDEAVVIKSFFRTVASACFRALCLSLLSWSGTGIPEHINKEIRQDATHKTLEFFLKLMKALNQIRSPATPRIKTTEEVDFFVSSIVGDRRESETFLYEELKDLVGFLLAKQGTDEECCLADIKHLIVKMATALSHEEVGLSSILLLERKVWILKAARFLENATFELPKEDQITHLLKKSFREQERGGDQLQQEMVQAVTLTSEVKNKITSMIQSFQAKEIGESMLSSSIHWLLLEILLSQAKAALIDTKLRLPPGTDGILEHLRLFLSFFGDEQGKKTDVKVLASIEAAARRMISLPYSFLEEGMTEGTINNIIEELQHKLKAAKERLGIFPPQLPRANFPNTSAGLGFLDSLLTNLSELLQRKPAAIAPFHNLLKSIRQDLVSLTSSLTRASSQEVAELLDSKDVGTRVTKMAYELEYVTDSVELTDPHWRHWLWLLDLQEEVGLVKELVAKELNKKEKNCENRAHQIPQVSKDATREADRPMVSLPDEEEAIIDRLTRGTFRRDVVSIVGMAGLGKTTIAKKVYDNPIVVYHFHRRMWCFVSQSYVLRDLLLNILGDVYGLTYEMQEMDDADLELKLYQLLKKKRYLIVMDDIWGVGAWTLLERSFPDDGNGSRIMITTRLHNVPLLDTVPHSLRALSQDECWKLMEMRIFQKEGCCPEELQDVGKEIAKQCKGLPLAVVSVAGILEKTEKKLNSWRRISEELNTRVIDDPETRCRDILELSYNHLPAHLKACFLYLGAFQEDRDVPARKLIRLWMAEGFIQKNEGKITEEIGEDYLRDLIDRSLVMISQMKSTGGVKACRIHDLLLDLCRSTSKEDRFLQIITSKETPYASFHYLDDDEDFDPDDPSLFAKYEGHRFCVHLKRKHFVYSRPSGPCTRSLLFVASNDTHPWRPFDVSFIFQNFRLVKVLDLESINLVFSVPAAIELLLLLRYLALSGFLDSIPQSISKLWRLQTIIVKGLSGKVVLPDAFWCMESLRHAHVRNQVAFKLKGDSFEDSNKLVNLVTFSSPTLSYGRDTEKMLRKLPNLHKLRCTFRETWDDSGQCNPFPRLEFLTQLESLNIKYSGRGDCNPHEFNLPSCLRKLTLSRFRLSVDHLSSIGKLPKLEVLKMLSGSLEEPIWNMKEDEFRELKYLKLDSLDIVKWNASSDHLPNLQQLVLWNCRELEEISSDLFLVPTLTTVAVRRCSQSIEQRIRDIVEGESLDWIQLFISH